MMSSSFYAVRTGRQPGIYDSWDTCLKQVHQFSGAIYKKFKSRNDAEAFINNTGSNAVTNGMTSSTPFNNPVVSTSFQQSVLTSTSGSSTLFTNENILNPFKTSNNNNNNKNHVDNSAQSLIQKRKLSTDSRDNVKILKPSSPQLSSRSNSNNKSVYRDNHLKSRQIKPTNNPYLNNNNSNNNYNAQQTNKRKLSTTPSMFRTNIDIKEFRADNMLRPAVEDAIVLYTDGGCQDNRNVDGQVCPAGWGVVVLYVRQGEAEINARVLSQLYGPVKLDVNDEFYIGAEKGSNNTAELSAIGEALLWLRDHSVRLTSAFPALQRPLLPVLSPRLQSPSLEQSESGEKEQLLPPVHQHQHQRPIPVHIRFDSEYAAKSVMGIYNGAKNADLINNIRKIYTEVVYTTYDVSVPSSSINNNSKTAAFSSSSSSSFQSANTATTDQLSSSSSSSSVQQQQHQRFYISFSHVKGHSDNKWNECADRLAAKGITGLCCNEGRYRTKDTLMNESGSVAEEMMTSGSGSAMSDKLSGVTGSTSTTKSTTAATSILSNTAPVNNNSSSNNNIKDKIVIEILD